MTNIIKQNLVELRNGLLVSHGHGKLITTGAQKYIISSFLCRSEINKLLYLLEGDTCHGILRLTTADKITVPEFKELSSDHCYTNDERMQWWPSKQVLFKYSFDLVTVFSSPRPVTLSSSPAFFTRNFEFCDSTSDKISSVSSYDACLMSDKQLLNDWHIVQAWYTTKRTGGLIKHSMSTITTLGTKIYDEISIRASAGTMPPVKMFDVRPENLKLLTLKSFVPMKAQKTFHADKDLLKYMFDTGKMYAVEKMYPGIRCILVKENNTIKLFSGTKQDLTLKFDHVVSEAVSLSTKSLVLDGVLYFEDGPVELESYITNGGLLPDQKLRYYVFDCVYFDKDLFDHDWSERKSLLHSLLFTNHIREVSGIMVNNVDDAHKAISLLRNLKGSTGVMIKRYTGKYYNGAASDTWIRHVQLSESTTTTSKGIPDISGTSESDPVPGPDDQGKEDPESCDWDNPHKPSDQVTGKGLVHD